jgi:hypothetical protein
VIRELAENPNVHQAHSAGRELYVDAARRFAIYLGTGTGPESATVQRVRLDADGVEPALLEIRGLLRGLGRRGTEWELGESCTPPDLVERLLALGVRRIEHEPVSIGMVLDGPPAWDVPAGVVARPVASPEELVQAREIQRVAFDDPRPVDPAHAQRDFGREGLDGSTFLTWLDGRAVAAGYAAYTAHGLILFGGATLPEARGRGAYRALVAARADEALARGTPAVVTHAGQMSQPILERLGFRAVARIDRLIDVLDS